VTLDLFDDLYDDPGLDRALASGLSALAPEVEPVDVALAELRPRFQRARTRRRVMQTSAALAGLLVVGGSIVVAASPNTRRAHVSVESPARHTETTKPSNRPSRTAPHARVHVAPKAPPATVPPPVSSYPHTSAPRPPVAVALPTTRPSSPATTPKHATSPPPTVAPVVRYDSLYGSISVRFQHGQMKLVGVYADPGYRGYVEAKRPQYIDVRFTRDGHRSSEIQLSVVNGRIVQNEDQDSWAWRGVSSVSPVSKNRAGVHRARPPVGPGGRLAGASIERANPGRKNAYGSNRGVSV
jgi:hypothetical protein